MNAPAMGAFVVSGLKLKVYIKNMLTGGYWKSTN